MPAAVAFRGGKAGAAGRLRAARPSHPASALQGLDGQVGLDGSSPGGGGGRRRRRVLLLAAAPAVIGASARPPMRLLAGWLLLSLAAVWLARRMWTLRSPLTRSLYVNMTSGPGGPAAPAGGRKEDHQVRPAGGRGRGGPAFARSAAIVRGGGLGASESFPAGPSAAAPRRLLLPARLRRPPVAPPRARARAPRPSPDPHCSRARRWLPTLGHLGARRGHRLARA